MDEAEVAAAAMASSSSSAEELNNGSLFHSMFDWAYVGVDFDLPGNGGADCVAFLSPTQRVVESGLASVLGLLIMARAYPLLTLPATSTTAVGGHSPRSESQAPGKRLLLVLMCLTWGCELGFKFATRQMIWIFNPCHIATAVQIYLLASSPSKAVSAAFRLHMHMLTGAPIAILFPVINTRMLPFETEVYYIQHILMLVIPFYLMSLGDPYIPERLCDFSWAAMTFGALFVYHFLPLQLLAIVSQVNLNNMLCPAVSDPFHGPYYRLFAIAHQSLLIPSLGKMYATLARHLGWCPPLEPEESVAELIKEELAAAASASASLSSPASRETSPTLPRSAVNSSANSCSDRPVSEASSLSPPLHAHNTSSVNSSGSVSGSPTQGSSSPTSTVTSNSQQHLHSDPGSNSPRDAALLSNASGLKKRSEVSKVNNGRPLSDEEKEKKKEEVVLVGEGDMLLKMASSSSSSNGHLKEH